MPEEVQQETAPSTTNVGIDIMEGLNNILELDDLGFAAVNDMEVEFNIDVPVSDVLPQSPTQPQTQAQVQPEHQTKASNLPLRGTNTFVRRRDKKKNVPKEKPFIAKEKLKKIRWRKGHLCTNEQHLIFEGKPVSKILFQKLKK